MIWLIRQLHRVTHSVLLYSSSCSNACGNGVVGDVIKLPVKKSKTIPLPFLEPPPNHPRPSPQNYSFLPFYDFYFKRSTISSFFLLNCYFTKYIDKIILLYLHWSLLFSRNRFCNRYVSELTTDICFRSGQATLPQILDAYVRQRDWNSEYSPEWYQGEQGTGDLEPFWRGRQRLVPSRTPHLVP